MNEVIFLRSFRMEVIVMLSPGYNDYLIELIILLGLSQ